MSHPDWHPIPLEFTVTQTAPAPAGLKIASVACDDFGVRSYYTIVPPLAPSAHGPRGEAEDDVGNRYDDAGGAFGLTPDKLSTDGVLTLPLPPPNAHLLRIRITWDSSIESIREAVAHEIEVALPC